MKFQILALEPTAAALRKMSGFGYLLNPQRTPVESAGEIFAARRHRQLHMIDTRNSQFVPPAAIGSLRLSAEQSRAA
jgi:hypothetical protein